jgi:ArsR family transcriptional regulator
MREIVDITKALADETRLRIMALLFDGELCVCQILEVFDLAPSTVSKHLYILKQARLVETRKSGKWIYYRLPDKSAPAEIIQTVDWLRKTLSNQLEIKGDYMRLKRIVRIEPQALCERRRETA